MAIGRMHACDTMRLVIVRATLSASVVVTITIIIIILIIIEQQQQQQCGQVRATSCHVTQPPACVILVSENENFETNAGTKILYIILIEREIYRPELTKLSH